VKEKFMPAKKVVDSPAEVSTEGTTDAPPATDPSEVPFAESFIDYLVDEVLAGAWGDAVACAGRLENAGHSSKDVLMRVNERLSRGAPAAYRPSAIGLLKQVQEGLWGNEKDVAGRLAGAGFGAHVVAEVLRNLEKS
jgi:hypothetical protein